MATGFVTYVRLPRDAAVGLFVTCNALTSRIALL